MSTAVAVVGLTFRGTDIQVLDGLFLQIVQGLDGVPTVRGRDVTVPGLAGRIPRGRVADRLEILLEGWIRGVSTTEASDRIAYRSNVAAMQALFDPTLTPGELVATLEDGSTQTINARTLDVDTEHRLPSFSVISIDMESVDPYWVVEGS